MSERPDDYHYLRRVFAKYEGRGESLRRLLEYEHDRANHIRQLRAHFAQFPQMMEELKAVLLDLLDKSELSDELESRLSAILTEIGRQSEN